jgi:PAS domain S-box-containing protein
VPERSVSNSLSAVLTRFRWRWLVLAALLLSCLALTHAASSAIRAWKAESAQAVQRRSEALLNWLEEGYAPVSAVGVLFETSGAVGEVEFLDAVQNLEARATASFVDTIAVLRPRADASGWRVEHSSEPLGPLPAGALLGGLPTVETAREQEGQLILGPSVAIAGDTKYSLLALGTRDASGPLVILALVSLDTIVEDLFAQSRDDGLSVFIEGSFLQSEGPALEQVLYGAPRPEAAHAVTTRTVSGAADLSITWFIEPTFRKGPDTAQAELTRIFGFVGTVGLCAFVGWLMAHSRIVERKVESATAELATKERQFRSLLESAPDAMVVTDEQGLVVMVNRQTEQLFGYGRDELRGRPIEMLVPERHREGHATKRLGYLRSATSRPMGVGLELTGLTRDAREIPVDVSLSPIESDHGTHVVASLRDITERKRADDALRQSNEALEQARRAADEANEAKSNFLANMSHEIRTPMNAILGMSYLCLQTSLNPKQRGYIEKVHRSASSLLGLINDILDFSKIEAGKLDMESIDFRLEDVFDNLANLVGLRAQEKDLELLFDIKPGVPMALEGDPLRLGQVLLNLANNAVKFTEGGEVVIGVSQTGTDGDAVILRFFVRDTGIGLSEGERTRLFESFSQADASTTRRYGGTGLGLAISRRLVDLMHGEIGVESEPGEGSTFWFTARFEARHDEPQEECPVAAGGLQGMHVLAVDDNATAREIMRAMLDTFQYRTQVARSGAEALEAIEAADRAGEPFEVVLMDWKMPGMNGVEAVRSLRALEGLHVTPRVLMVTAFGKEELLEEAADLPLDGILIKPVSPSLLNDRIMEVFGKTVARGGRGAARRAAESAAQRKLAGARVLLVEDNDTNQEIALELLNQAGVVAEVANNGREALEMLEKSEFDGVLMDMQMPVMDGVTATRAIRGQRRLEGLPVIAMTANAMAGDRERCLEAGMNDHIAKPVNVQEMFTTMAKWITAREAVEEPVPVASGDAGGTLPAVEGVDTAAGLARVAGNERLYARLLERFGREQGGFAARVRESMDRGDVEGVVRLAHTLKGVAGNLGARRIAAAAKELEQACGNDADSARLATLLAGVEEALEPTMAAIEVWGGAVEAPAEQHAVAAPADLASILDRLQELLEHYDAEAVDAIGELEQAGTHTIRREDVRRLRQRVDDFDFDQALEVLASIRAEGVLE